MSSKKRKTQARRRSAPAFKALMRRRGAGRHDSRAKRARTRGARDSRAIRESLQASGGAS